LTSKKALQLTVNPLRGLSAAELWALEQICNRIPNSVTWNLPFPPENPLNIGYLFLLGLPFTVLVYLIRFLSISTAFGCGGAAAPNRPLWRRLFERSEFLSQQPSPEKLDSGRRPSRAQRDT